MTHVLYIKDPATGEFKEVKSFNDEEDVLEYLFGCDDEQEGEAE